MLNTPRFATRDVAEVKRLLRAHPWVLLVSPTSSGVVASHCPVLVEDSADDVISIVTHLGRPDDVSHEIGQHEVLAVAQGSHGYISSSWYDEGEDIPTWDHVTAHLWGFPELLDTEENLRALERLVDDFEAPLPEPRSLRRDPEGARRHARGTVGIRIRATRFQARLKLSQNKPERVARNIAERLESDCPYSNKALAAEIRRINPGLSASPEVRRELDS